MTDRFDGRRFDLGACGDDVTIYEWVRVLHAEAIRIGDHVIVDDFVFLDGGAGLTIGSYVHVAGYCSIVGGGVCELEDFSGLAAGVRLITGTEVVDGSGLTNPTIPAEFRAVHRGSVRIGRHAMLGTNVVVHTDVVIGEGTIVGSGSVVTKNLPPWTICVGMPARPVKERPSERILEFERALRERDAAAGTS
jgi:acetyltransferase-like isoleucine patch superfamily enzyme